MHRSSTSLKQFSNHKLSEHSSACGMVHTNPSIIIVLHRHLAFDCQESGQFVLRGGLLLYHGRVLQEEQQRCSSQPQLGHSAVLSSQANGIHLSRSLVPLCARRMARRALSPRSAFDSEEVQTTSRSRSDLEKNLNLSRRPPLFPAYPLPTPSTSLFPTALLLVSSPSAPFLWVSPSRASLPLDTGCVSIRIKVSLP